MSVASTNPEAAECHCAESGGTKQQTRDVEVHRGRRIRDRSTSITQRVDQSGSCKGLHHEMMLEVTRALLRRSLRARRLASYVRPAGTTARRSPTPRVRRRTAP